MNDMKKIVFAGGCFWGIQAYFKKVKGVLNTEVGYIDGSTDNPSYLPWALQIKCIQK